MLPNMNLDDEQFEAISEKAMKSIYKYAPSWTDYNEHDPGITLIELLAWMKEAQEYHLNQISEKTRFSFLKLLGKSPHLKQPARTLVQVDPYLSEVIIPKGTTMLAGQIPFETDETMSFSKRKLIDGFSNLHGAIHGFTNQIEVDSGKLYHEIFGDDPKGGEICYLCFDTPFSTQKAENIYWDIWDEYPVKRNTLNGEFVPLATLTWQYYSNGQWCDFQKVEDLTHGFLFDGCVTLTIKEPMAKFQITGYEDGYWIRVILKESFYEVPPILNGMEVNLLPVSQVRSHSVSQDFDQIQPQFYLEHALALRGDMEVYVYKNDHWMEIHDFDTILDYEHQGKVLTLGESLKRDSQISKVRVVCFDLDFSVDREVAVGDGFPYQTYDLRNLDFMRDGFTLMVEDEHGGYLDWTQVDTFDTLGPESLSYSYKEDRGILVFGDCEKGMAPTGRILIIQCKETLGQGGNVKEGQITTWEHTQPIADIYNRNNAKGGRDAEDIDHCFLRARKELRQINRGIINRDYEYLVKQTPGLLVKACEVIPADRLLKNDGSVEENSISMVVEPYTGSKRRSLNPAYVENIRRQIEPKRMIGTKINILAPEYVGILIFGEIKVKPYYRDARERILEAINQFFERELSGFGKTIQHSALYGVIDILDCVLEVSSLVLDAQGKNMKRSVGGDVLLPPNGVAYMLSVDFVINS